MLTKGTSASAFLVAALCAAVSLTANAQTSVGLSVYGAFSGTTTGNGTRQSPANQAGGLFELRHIANPIFGYEATYSWNRANENESLNGASPLTCAVGSSLCPPPPVSVPANAHEITADWIPSVHVANFRPFGVLGAGVLLDVPTTSQVAVTPCTGPACTGTAPPTNVPTKTSTQAVYVYGAGLDWGLLPHLGVRFQYRGNLYKAPDLDKLYSSTGAFTHTAEPMIGVYFSL